MGGWNEYFNKKFPWETLEKLQQQAQKTSPPYTYISPQLKTKAVEVSERLLHSLLNGGYTYKKDYEVFIKW